MNIIYKLFDFANLAETHRYMIPELNENWLRFVTAVDNLHKFTSKYLFYVNQRFELMDESEQGHRWDKQTWERYYNLEAALHRLTDRVFEAYKSYRATVRNTLFI
jgi:hypothetical protein